MLCAGINFDGLSQDRLSIKGGYKSWQEQNNPWTVIPPLLM